MAATRFWCLVAMSLVYCSACLSSEHDDENKDNGFITVSSGKGTQPIPIGNDHKIIRGRKLALEKETIHPQQKVTQIGSSGKTERMKMSSRIAQDNGNFGKQMNELKNSPKAKEHIDRDSDEEGLVALTADYWRARHHPPKNN